MTTYETLWLIGTVALLTLCPLIFFWCMIVIWRDYVRPVYWDQEQFTVEPGPGDATEEADYPNVWRFQR